MKKSGSILRRALLALGCLALVISLAALSNSPAQAVIPGPDCGPTREWTCAVPGCPSCYEVLFEGTICEKAAFEKSTGRVCSPI